MTPATQLQPLRASTARDLETWRAMLAFYQKRGDRVGTSTARGAVSRVEGLLRSIDGLLTDGNNERNRDG